MQPHTLKSIASATEVFSVARRQLQTAVDAANHLGLVVPDSFPDAIDHLQDWAASVEAEARGLLQLTDPANATSPLLGSALPDAGGLQRPQHERQMAAGAEPFSAAMSCLQMVRHASLQPRCAGASRTVAWWRWPARGTPGRRPVDRLRRRQAWRTPPWAPPTFRPARNRRQAAESR